MFFGTRYRVEYWSYGRWDYHDDCEFRSIRRAARFMASQVSRPHSVRHYRIIKIDSGRMLMRMSRTGHLNDHEIPGDERWFPAEQDEFTLIEHKPGPDWWE